MKQVLPSMSYFVHHLQVNLDFSSEADMVDKMRLGIALQPIATALFANSPFRNGEPTGYLSWRSHVWTDTDNDRYDSSPATSKRNLASAKYRLQLTNFFHIEATSLIRPDSRGLCKYHLASIGRRC